MNEPILVVCPHCHSPNRLPGERLKQGPKCGRCREKLFAGRPVELTAATFELHLVHSGIPLLVDFWAPWCGPCKMMTPVIEQAAGHLEPEVRVAKVNTEAEPLLASRFRIQSIPTLAIFRNGREFARQSGAMNFTDLVLWVRARS